MTGRIADLKVQQQVHRELPRVVMFPRVFQKLWCLLYGQFHIFCHLGQNCEVAAPWAFSHVACLTSYKVTGLLFLCEGTSNMRSDNVNRTTCSSKSFCITSRHHHLLMELQLFFLGGKLSVWSNCHCRCHHLHQILSRDPATPNLTLIQLV